MSSTDHIPNVTPDIALATYDQAVRHYIQACRDRVPDFIEDNYSFANSLKLHKRAIGHDLWRAPANLFMALPNLGMMAGAQILKKAGAVKKAAWMQDHMLFLETNVARELQYRLFRDLLQLPYRDQNTHLARDGFAETLFGEQLLLSHLEQDVGADFPHEKLRQLEQNLAHLLSTYTDSRAAAADIANQIVTLSAGAALFKQTTPGALSIGPLLASSFAHHTAIASFPLGSSLGGLWYGVFPVSASAGLTVAATGAVMGASAVLTAFSGVITDPVQKSLGLHQKRLHQLIDCIELELRGSGQQDFSVKDHYIARLMDFLDVVRLAKQNL